ncbi:M4 family metallopeptidase [Granulosicoccaceae sp. 1_MG-2023]|nr:M4 family metallopeptidase [Granulosicoccaceae sp. 1_MG-2023]
MNKRLPSPLRQPLFSGALAALLSSSAVQAAMTAQVSFPDNFRLRADTTLSSCALSARTGPTQVKDVAVPSASSFSVPWQSNSDATATAFAGPAGLSAAQRAALKDVRTADQDFAARFGDDGSVRSLRFSRDTALSVQSKSAADPLVAVALGRDFLLQNRALLHKDGDDSDFTLTRRFSDALGQEHLVYEQHVNGLPVWGSEVRLHLQADQSPALFQGRYLSPAQWPDAEATISAAQAEQVARDDLRYTPEILARELLYYRAAGEDSPRLAWRIELRAGLGLHFNYFVDAGNAELIHRMNLLAHGSSVSASGRDLSGQTTDFTAWYQDSLYFMVDPTFPLNDVTEDYDPISNGIYDTGDAAVYSADNSDGSTVLHITSGSRDSGWDAAAVSAMDNMRRVYDFYLNRFGRKSLDNNNMSLQSIVHYGEDVANAFYSGKIMVYGDGDGTTFSSLASCDDVAAHEMTHGVIQFTANLLYENQSGALNESFADVFAVLFDEEDWTIGEDCTLASPGYTRSLSSPELGLTTQPDNFDDYQYLPNTEDGDYGGVHINNGIPNYAFYLTASTIGNTAAGKIYYRALTTYLTRSSGFLDAREALEQSAEDLYGADSAELNAVSNAWDTVNITATTAGSDTNSSSTSPVDGEDLLVYIAATSSSAGDIYVQNFGSDWNGSSSGALSGPVNSTPVSIAYQPSLATLSDGTYVLYVGTDLNLYATRLGVQQTSTVNGEGIIRNAAISPDGDKIAFLLSDYDSSIYIYSVSDNAISEYPLTLTDYSESSSGSATVVRYADSLAFDYTGTQVLFDARLCAPIPDKACDEDDLNSGSNYWSIGTLDLSADGRSNFPFPSQPSTVSLGYPHFAYNRNDVAVLDYAEYDSSNDNFISAPVSYQFETQQLSQISPGVEGASVCYSMPTFWADDEQVTWRYYDGDQAAVSAVSEASDWSGSDSTVLVNTSAVYGPIMHRSGVRTLASLSNDPAALDFGTVSRGSSATRSLTLRNQGNSALTITSITSSSGVWSHNGLNATLTAGAQITVDVVFTPDGSADDYRGSLLIESDAADSALVVALSGSQAGSGSGGGAAGLLLLPLFVLWRTRRRVRRTRGN